jgi:predicted ATPase
MLEAIGRICRAPGGDTLIAWMKDHAPTWLVQMPTFLGPAESETLQQKLQGATRDRMLREFSEGIEVMTEQRPFILVLEDLQWSDYSTLDLLAALAHRQERARFLAIGTYRPEEMLAPGNPLNRIAQELRIHNLCAELALGPLQEDDVAAYLCARFSVNPFPEALVRAFHRRTEGNPLFLINVVDDLVAQGVFEQTAQGWTFPGGVEVVEERIPQNVRLLVAKQGERLLPMERRVLEAASIVGMEFSAALVATALEAAEEEVEEWSAGLATRQHFLQPAGFSAWPDGTRSERYRFLHALYQHLWHERVGIARRQRMSRRIAEREEAAYGDRAEEVAAELAVYFEQGQDYGRAAYYRARAADNAIRRCAHQEAVTHLNKGLKLLSVLPDTPERTQRELALHATLGISLQAIRGYGNPAVEQVYAHAQKLAQQAREPAQLFPVLFGLWQLHLVRAEYRTARELGEQLLNLADSTRDSGLLVEAHGAVGVTLFHLGEIVSARMHLERSTSLYEPDRHRSHVRTYNQDPWVACQSYSGQALWLLGYPDQGLRRTQEAWRYAQDLAHPFSQAFALHDVVLLYQFHRDVPAVLREAEMLLTLSREHGFPMWELAAMGLQGWAYAEQGRAAEGLARMRQGASERRDIGTRLRIPYHQTRIAELCGKAGQPTEGLAQLQKAFALIEVTGERWWEAEMYRVRGELTRQNLKPQLPRVAEQEAEECFHKAVEIARRQQAKSLELRAVTSLSRLWHAQGKHEQARSVLAEIYSWFTEGFETADLQEAKTLLG